MKSLLFILLFMSTRLMAPGGDTGEVLDPTGTYILKGTVVKHHIMGHSGEIRVKLLDDGKVAICFYINKGYPDYQSGSLIDTLPYADNQVKYTPANSDCSILFCFSLHKVETQQLFMNPRSGCGFSQGVMTSAFFEKMSSEKPVIQDLSQHGISR